MTGSTGPLLSYAQVIKKSHGELNPVSHAALKLAGVHLITRKKVIAIGTDSQFQE